MLAPHVPGWRAMSEHIYTVYGLTVSTPFACPGLSPAADGATPDVIVQNGSVPRQLPDPVLSEERWDVDPERFLVRGGRRAGRFLVESAGVTVERNPEGRDELLGECFVSEVLPAILRYRGVLVLHANAAVAPRGVVLVAGESGAGKSTTLAALLESGCAMLADDVTTVTLAPGGQLEVLPGVPRCA
jgi:ABC-type multidrug transport system fused ATPase/permease subunit